LQAIEDVYKGGAPMSPSIARRVVATFSKFSFQSNHDFSLSPREKEILASLVKGNSYKLVAAELAISIQTVKTHIKKVYEKLHVHSQSEAVAKAIRERLV
jgi:DNA-binding NarL/FixJ family response regulator